MVIAPDTLALFQVGWSELILIGLVAILLFGRRLPEVGRSLGRGIVEFKKGLHEMSDEVESASDDKTSPNQPGKTSSTSKDDKA